MIKLTIDGREVEVPPGTNLIEAARMAGAAIPYFCYHPHLSIVGQCRICMVEVEGMPRLVIACATPAAEGMVVRSETSERVREARDAVMEFLLLNHPLDCPVCDQAGECLLQDHSFEQGSSTTDMVETRRTFHGFERRLIGPHVVQNQNRCIHCSRCIRFTREISETAALAFKSRGNSAYIDTFDGRPFDDFMSGCAADVCPVGALTVREFRFRKRAWRLRSTPSVCPGCSIGCNVWIDHHEKVVYRFTPRRNDAVNATWLCDYGRFLADSLNEQGVHQPYHGVKGRSEPQSWHEALRALALHLKAAKSVRVVGSANLSNEVLFLARELFVKELKGEMVVPVFEGEPRRMKNGAGAWLFSTDAHPNSHGARRLGLPIVDAGKLAQFMYGAADLTVILDPLAHPFLATDEALQLLKVGPMLALSRTEHPINEVAQWLLPAASLAHEDGTFVSSTGEVQRFVAAFGPTGEARPRWLALAALARELGVSRLDLASPEAVFETLAGHEKAFAGLEWKSLGSGGHDSYRERRHVG